jgi:hypothetical protein
MPPWACPVCRTAIPYEDYGKVLGRSANRQAARRLYFCRMCRVELLPSNDGDSLLVGSGQPPDDEDR